MAATGLNRPRAPNTLNQTNRAAFRRAKPRPAKEHVLEAATYTRALVRTPCGWVCAQAPLSKAPSLKGAKPNLSTSRIAVGPSAGLTLPNEEQPKERRSAPWR